MADSPEKSLLGEGVDFIGLGKLARSIPKEVYTQTAETILNTFETLIAPITTTTHGFGRYIRQKFDNMVEIEKALGVYALEKACKRAKKQAAESAILLIQPTHPKSFVRCLEEASRETDPLLHELWSNLLASQMLEGIGHPHFIEILSHFSPAEAKLLMTLRPKSLIGDDHRTFGIPNGYDWSPQWFLGQDDADAKEWTLSCTILMEFKLADVVLSSGANSRAILYRSPIGSAFLKAVSSID